MFGYFSSSLPGIFPAKLNRYYWACKKLKVGHFQIADYVILRITKYHLIQSETIKTLSCKIKKLSESPLQPVIVIEGDILTLMSKRNKKDFSKSFSANKYSNYIEIINLAFELQINLINSLHENMTIALLTKLQSRISKEYKINYLNFDSQIEGISDKKFFHLVTYLSAFFGEPFEELSNNQILKALREVRIPGFGKKTIEKIAKRIERSITKY